jgi:hypothetical protein
MVGVSCFRLRAAGAGSAGGVRFSVSDIEGGPRGLFGGGFLLRGSVFTPPVNYPFTWESA